MLLPQLKLFLEVKSLVQIDSVESLHVLVQFEIIGPLKITLASLDFFQGAKWSLNGPGRKFQLLDVSF